MRIRSIAIHGFRGFNERREINIHPNLTLIAAANSHGKTSISEALEWLLYNPLPKPQTLAEQLVQDRKIQGLSQKEMANRLGVDPSTLARRERGER